MKSFTETYMVNEWLFFGKKKDNNSGSEKKGSGFFGNLTNFMNKMGLLKSSTGSKGSELQEAFKTIAKEKAEKAKNRQKELLNSKESALAAKLLAKHRHSENQLDLKNQQRINVYNAEKSRLNDCAERWKNNTNIYTQEENDAYDQAIDKELKEIEGTEMYDNCQKLNDLRRMIAIDENGNPRSAEDIQKALGETGDNKSELAKILDEWNSTITKDDNFKEFLNTDKDELQKILGDVAEGIVNSTVDGAHLDEDEKEAQKLKDEFDKNTQSVSAYNEAIKKYEDQEKEHSAAVNDIEALKSKYGIKKDQDINSTDKNDLDPSTKILHPDAEPNDYRDIIGSVNFYKGESIMSKDEYAEALKAKNIPNEIISKITDKFDECRENGTDMSSFKSDYITGSDSIISDEECNNQIKHSQDEYSTNLKRLEAKEHELSQSIKDSKNPKDMTDDELDKQFGEDAESIKTGKKLAEDPINGDMYVKDSDEYKKTLNQLNDGLKTIQNKKQDIAASREANLMARNEAAKHYKDNKSNSAPEELKASISSRSKDVENGEFIQDGKVGYYNITGKDSDGKFKYEFKEKPGIDASSEEMEEYKKERDKSLAQTPSTFYDQLGENDKPIKSAEKNEDGTYTVTYEDGSKEENMPEQKVVDAYAKRSWVVSAKISNNKSKADNLKTLNKILKVEKDSEGNTRYTINPDAIDKLKPVDKEIISDMLESPEKYNFTGANDSHAKTILDKDGELDITKIGGTDKDGNYVTIADTKDIDKLIDRIHMGSNSDDIEAVDNDNEDDEDVDYDEENDKDSQDLEVQDKDGKKKITNPAKIWKHKKNKLTKKTTKNYYKNIGQSNEESISVDEYKKKVQAYKARLEKQKKSSTTSNEQNLNSLQIILKENISYSHKEYDSELKIYLKGILL